MGATFCSHRWREICRCKCKQEPGSEIAQNSNLKTSQVQLVSVSVLLYFTVSPIDLYFSTLNVIISLFMFVKFFVGYFIFNCAISCQYLYIIMYVVILEVIIEVFFSLIFIFLLSYNVHLWVPLYLYSQMRSS